MSEPTTEAGRRLLGFIDAAIENTTNGVSWRNGAGYARVCAESSIPNIEAEGRAEALDDALAAICEVADSGGSEGLTWDDAIAACADALAGLSE